MTYEPSDHQVQVKVGACDASRTPAIYINTFAIAAIRSDATDQAEHWIVEITRDWPGTVPSDYESVNRLAFKLSMALDCVRALVELAPTPIDDEVAA